MTCDTCEPDNHGTVRRVWQELLEPPIKPRGEKELTLSVRLSGVGISLIGASRQTYYHLTTTLL